MVAPLRPGDPTHIGQFAICRLIGEGSQGAAYLGDATDGTPVAVKMLRPTEDSRVRQRFTREAETTQRVLGICTAQVLAVGQYNDRPYVVAEYINGPSLNQLVITHGPLTGDKLNVLAVGVATALVGIHEAGVVHRDLKPSNVLLGSGGPKVVDFGVSTHEDLLATTAAGRIMGTPAFMAPELFQGARGGPPADVFAWGLTMAFAATGRNPFQGTSLASMMHQIMFVLVFCSVRLGGRVRHRRSSAAVRGGGTDRGRAASRSTTPGGRLLCGLRAGRPCIR